MSDIFTQSGLQTPFQPLPRIKNKPPKYISRVFRWLSPLNTFKQNEIYRSCRYMGQARVPAHCLNRTGYFLASAM